MEDRGSGLVEKVRTLLEVSLDVAALSTLMPFVLGGKDALTRSRRTANQTSPNEKRNVSANARRTGNTWTVVLYDMDQAVGQKRGAQVALIFSRLFPKGYERETFAGKPAHKLDARRIAELSQFVESGRQKLGVPGVSIGLIQDGKVVFEGGLL